MCINKLWHEKHIKNSWIQDVLGANVSTSGLGFLKASGKQLQPWRRRLSKCWLQQHHVFKDCSSSPELLVHQKTGDIKAGAKVIIISVVLCARIIWLWGMPQGKAPDNFDHLGFFNVHWHRTARGSPALGLHQNETTTARIKLSRAKVANLH